MRATISKRCLPERAFRQARYLHLDGGRYVQELNPVEWAIRPLQKYAVFSGRASRAEYWWYTLASILVGFGFGFLDKFFGGPLIGVYGPLSLVLTLGLLIPGLAVEIRRLHD